MVFNGSHFGDHTARLGGEIAARFDLQSDPVAKCGLQFFASGIPEMKITGQIGMHFAGFIGDRQAATGADHRQRTADLHGYSFERTGYFSEVR